jgi:hypothetical protein
VQPSRKPKRYKEFLYDVLNVSGPQFVLLCAVALGQARVFDLKKTDRVGLIGIIKSNDNNKITGSFLQSHVVIYNIPAITSKLF